MVCCLVHDGAGALAVGVLESIARTCSPRIDARSPSAVAFDASGLSRVIGPPDVVARDVHALAASHGVPVRVAIARSLTTAWILAHARGDLTVVPPGGDRRALAPLPLDAVLSVSALEKIRPASFSEIVDILRRWGLHTVGDLAGLGRADVRARLGLPGERLHRAACGEAVAPLVPTDEGATFIEQLDLDWPVEGLQPLAFVIGRLSERLEARLERADRGAVAVTTTLTLVTRSVHERTVRLPAPMREARVLRTLVLLDLETHPPPAGIDRVTLTLEVAPGRIVRPVLFHHALSVEDVSTLLARLRALMGDTRVGSPVVPDTHDSRRIETGDFVTEDFRRAEGKGQRAKEEGRGKRGEVTGDGGMKREAGRAGALRRLRLPVAARVVVECGVPVDVQSSARGVGRGRVVTSAGPWRTSGAWWTSRRETWDRDEWDVELADGSVLLVTRDRLTERWTVDGIYD
jgi:protein ImuB